MNMQAVSSGGDWCLEDDHDMEVLLSRCMAKTTCTPPVHSKTLKSCDRASHSDFVMVEYRCISGDFWKTYHRSNFRVFLLAPPHLLVGPVLLVHPLFRGSNRTFLPK